MDKDGKIVQQSLVSVRRGSRGAPNNLSPENGDNARHHLFLESTCHYLSHKSRREVTEVLMALAENLVALSVASAENSIAARILLMSW